MKHSEKYGANVIDRFKAGLKITTGQYVKALRDNEIIRREFELLFQDVDFLLTPAVQIFPPRIGEHKISAGGREMDVVSSCVRFTRLANITRLPAIVIPFGYSTGGLPLNRFAGHCNSVRLLHRRFTFEYSSSSTEIA
jgi:aspartyl-tRNA(Asn)/glutamyl-tRNA(Gln) amidotransferase subunit A